MPSVETLEICFENNPHGCGYTFNRNNINYIYKGFMTLKELIDSLNKTKPSQSESVMIHFRVASIGSVKKSNCHPFIMSTNYSEMQELTLKTNLPILVHNGTFKHFNDKKNDYSDTMQFNKLIAPIFEYKYIREFKPVCKFIDNYVQENNSRMAVMARDGKIYTFGKWIKDDKTNLLFSNENYKFITDRFAFKQLEFDF